MKQIPLDNAQPLIRYAQMLTITDGAPYGIAKAYDNRIFLCVKGSGRIVISNTTYLIQPGTLLLWGPGLAYRYEPDETMTLLGFNFDFTQQSASKVMPIPPVKSSLFDPALITEQVSFSDTDCFRTPLCLTDMLFLKGRFLEIKEEFMYKKRRYRHRCSALFSDLLALLVRAAEAPVSGAEKHSKADEIIAYIQPNYQNDLSNRHLGEVFGYHPGYIGRLIRMATGMPTHQYLLNYRIERAIDYLQSGEANVSQTCFLCGFHDLAHFSKSFRAKTGRAPSDYLR